MNTPQYTPVSEIPLIVESARKAFATGKTLSYEWRVSQLTALKNLVTENLPKFVQSLNKDLGVSEFVADGIDMDSVVQEVDYTLAHLKEWMADTQVSVPLLQQPGAGRRVKEPYGVACVIAPWNYPGNVTLRPSVGAIAAGNCLVIKPSEVSSHTSALFAELIPKYLDNECIKVVTGAVPETQKLLEQKFDYIFYTGNTMVGKIIMKAAAEHLTPVTLELGGKSPCIVDSGIDMQVVANRICWGKFLNCGQTCVAPDYVLIKDEIREQFLETMKKTIKTFFTEKPQTCQDYSRIVNQNHAKRLGKLLVGEKVYFGGDVDENDRFVHPTIVLDPKPDSKIMQDEIFGPILPVLSIKNVDDAINFINKRPKPLALYIFSHDQEAQEKIVRLTSSGGVCINDVIMHIACPDLPFGGVGDSGMGAYNGKSTFDTFTHSKSVLKKATWVDPSLRYPPYTEQKKKMMKIAKGGIPNFHIYLRCFLVLLVAFVAYLAYPVVLKYKNSN